MTEKTTDDDRPANGTSVARRRRPRPMTIILLAWLVIALPVVDTSSYGPVATALYVSWVAAAVLLLIRPFYRFLYRMSRSTTGMPPARFSTQHPNLEGSYKVGRAKVLVGAQGTPSAPGKGNLLITVRINENNLLLVETLMFKLASPSYVIPKAEISSVEHESNLTVIHLLDGTKIRLNDYVGAPLDLVLSGEFETKAAAEMLAQKTHETANAGQTNGTVIRCLAGFDIAALAVVVVLGMSHQWAYATGDVIGSLLVSLLLWRLRRAGLKGRTSSSRRSPTGVLISSVLNLVVAAVIIFASGLVKVALITAFATTIGTFIAGMSVFLIVMSTPSLRAKESGTSEVSGV
jgi:hypothetical protein